MYFCKKKKKSFSGKDLKNLIMYKHYLNEIEYYKIMNIKMPLDLLDYLSHYQNLVKPFHP